MPATLAVGVVCVLAMACGRYGPSANGGNGGATPNPTRSYQCASDRDCVVSCAIANDCNGQGCECTNVYHVRQLEELRAANERLCAGKRIEPRHYDCPRPTQKTVARCRQGTCSGETRPSGWMQDGFWFAPGAPPPRSCSTAADCIGDTIAEAGGCCNGTDFVAHSRAYRTWLGQWRAEACSDVTCPEPPSPAQPAQCYFDMRCDEGQCANTCPP